MMDYMRTPSEVYGDLCASKQCVNPATEASGLCLECELRTNTTLPKFKARLSQLLRQQRPERRVLDIFFAEAKRRGLEVKSGDQS